MIIRIVKMKFTSQGLVEFYKLFKESAPVIKSFKGCISVKLLEETKNNNLLFTLSEWETEKDLEYYRNSNFFRETWDQTKRLFEDKPEAWSTTEVI